MIDYKDLIGKEINLIVNGKIRNHAKVVAIHPDLGITMKDIESGEVVYSMVDFMYQVSQRHIAHWKETFDARVEEFRNNNVFDMTKLSKEREEYEKQRGVWNC